MFDDKILGSIREKLLDKKVSIAVAESVTAGLLAGALSTAKDAADFFQGGIIPYNLGQKSRHLKVDPIHADRCNCVSEAVARSMAEEVTRMFSASYGVAITGYSTITAGVNDRIYANYAISLDGKTIASGEITSAAKEGLPVQLDFVKQLLQIFLDTL